ncbi:hypothetical protein DPMN_175090 [Dreissena polymorpha]|uniref:Alpha-1,4 glucan phosphorylase n=1 Tax=Dreissena polymorpha TaxID=45954 RepID=A0A9D4IIE7_DREPO|nr:hypothetical protein DPMN_175090 [Dreissena polymorpha]
MAHLAIVGSHAINGVVAIYSEIIKNNTVAFLQKIGEDWVTDLYKLTELKQYDTNEAFLRTLTKVKQENKMKYIKTAYNTEVNVSYMFDIQVKRVHEYKRQLMNCMHIIHQYNVLVKRIHEFKRQLINCMHIIYLYNILLLLSPRFMAKGAFYSEIADTHCLPELRHDGRVGAACGERDVSDANSVLQDDADWSDVGGFRLPDDIHLLTKFARSCRWTFTSSAEHWHSVQNNKFEQDVIYWPFVTQLFILKVI